MAIKAGRSAGHSRLGSLPLRYARTKKQIRFFVFTRGRRPEFISKRQEGKEPLKQKIGRRLFTLSTSLWPLETKSPLVTKKVKLNSLEPMIMIPQIPKSFTFASVLIRQFKWTIVDWNSDTLGNTSIPSKDHQANPKRTLRTTRQRTHSPYWQRWRSLRAGLWSNTTAIRIMKYSSATKPFERAIKNRLLKKTVKI